MYGKDKTIELIKGIMDYDSNTKWGKALQHAVKVLEEELDDDEDVVEDLMGDIYNSHGCDLCQNDIRGYIKKYIS